MLRASISTPIGWLNMEATDWSIIALYFTSKPHDVQSDHPLIWEAKQQLQSYFNRERFDFKLPLDPPGTAFQRQVWEELNNIPYGQTSTYLKLAKKLGDENKVRAVAGANAANPIAIVIPCHRVIAGNGQLTGYAWGLDRKEWLLQHEQNRVQLKLF
jgi:methylated-DNA-[protein]-cysteine S-methyltransferase